MIEQAELGERYRCVVTGYEGVATARAEYLHGAAQVQISTLGKDDKPVSVWINEGWLEKVSEQKTGFSPA